MKTISDSLKLRQAQQREETLSKIEQAIGELSSERYQITVKNLTERTGLSRAVFSKPHVKEFLAQIAAFDRKGKPLPSEGKSDISKDYLSIAAKYEKAKRLNDLNAVKIAKLQNELRGKREECELLRGQLHVIMQKCRIKGIDISD